MTSKPAPRLSLTQVLLCGAAVVTLSMGIRHGFGLWLQPITMDRGWTRETFAFAIALQNLVWGLAGPFAGALADRFSAAKVLVVGALLYAAGLVLMALSTSALGFAGSAGVLLGMAQSGTTYAVVYGVIGRNVDPSKRSWAMGATAAAGSFGQFLMLPVENWLIGAWGWQNALFVLGCLALAIVPLALGLREPRDAHVAGPHQTIGAALREAIGYRSFQLLMGGYFVCGFQVVFIGVHLPSYLKDQGLSPGVATTALALIGLFNVFGTYAAGSLGQRWPKRWLLSAIYLLRSIAIAAFLALPLTPASVYVFSSAMGLLWLSTVPPTNAVVAQIFGVRYLSMLSGFVFLSHQVGSFLGAWLGGRLFDRTGSYDIVWGLAIALGVFAALVNLPVREHAIARPGVPAGTPA
jgi:predicted MFS family arabinose efflux permease